MDFLVIGLLFIGAMWFMTSRTRKQQAAAMAFRDNLQPGQEVMTIGRMYGTVVEVDGNRVWLELSDGVMGLWDKEGIARLVEPPVDEASEDDDVADDETADDQPYDDVEADDTREADVADRGADAGAPDVEVPDDASSLTDPDEDPKQPR